MITVNSFRVDLPEFASAPDYPSTLINYYIVLGGLLVSQRRFGPPGATVTNPPNNIYDMALEMFVAHNVVLEAKAQRAALAGGIPGDSTGAISGKSTGPISVSYDNSASLDPEAGHWNDTEYGKRFWKLVRMFGAGPVQLGYGGLYCGPTFNNTPLNGPAWPGPIFLPLGPVN